MLSIGIVGLPNVGKSTLFNALTKSSALAANYPFATIEPNVGIVSVPDERLAKLVQIYPTANIVPSTIRFVDIAGLVAGASEGEGLGNQFLSHIRNVNAIVQVVRAFKDPNVTHVSQTANPAADISTINTELILADISTVDKRLSKLEKEARANSKLEPLLTLTKKAKALLDEGLMLNASLTKEELDELTDLNLLSAKSMIYCFNVDETDVASKERKQQLEQLASPSQAVLVSAKIESELIELDEQDASDLRSSYGIGESSLALLVKAAYSTLGLQSYLTAGNKEVRAWTITKGSTAPQAAGVIHGDFERGFIAAEIVNFNDLISLGSMTACKAAGKVRTEGKTYIMQPDDVVEFRFNV